MKNKSNNKYSKFSKKNFREKPEAKNFSKDKINRHDDFQRKHNKPKNNKILGTKNVYEYESKNNYRKTPKTSNDIKIRKNNDQFVETNLEDFVWGRHSVLASLESGRPINRIWCTPEIKSSEKFFILLKETKKKGCSR